jgi:hypothetical protein
MSAHHLCQRCQWRTPLESLMETRERPPPMSKTSMVGPWEALSEAREHPPPMSETSRASPLGGIVRDPRASTTYVRDVDGSPPGRHCRRPRNADHLCQRHPWQAPWEALTMTQERPPPMSETPMAGPLGHYQRLGSITTYVGDVDGRPCGRCCRRPGSTHYLCRRHQWLLPLGRHYRRPRNAHHLCRKR